MVNPDRAVRWQRFKPSASGGGVRKGVERRRVGDSERGFRKEVWSSVCVSIVRVGVGVGREGRGSGWLKAQM